MLVKYWMKEEVYPMDANDSMQEAIRLMRQYQPPLLPVLKKGKLVGVVTDRDVKRASASDATSLEVHELAYLISRIKVKDIMSKNVISVPPDYTLEEAAALLMMNEISSMPVVNDQEEIVGIISQREIFLALISMSGFGQKGLQLAFEVEDRPGSIKDVTDIIRSYQGRLVSILTSYQRAKPGYRRLYVRVWHVDRMKLPEMESELKKKATLLYKVDHKEDKREEYVSQN